MKKYQIQRNVNGKLKTFILTPEEIRLIIKESEKEDIFEDFYTILEQDYDIDVQWHQEITDDIDIIYDTFNHVEDSDLSYWQNIDRTIDYLMDSDRTSYDYSKLRRR